MYEDSLMILMILKKIKQLTSFKKMSVVYIITCTKYCNQNNKTKYTPARKKNEVNYYLWHFGILVMGVPR